MTHFVHLGTSFEANGIATNRQEQGLKCGQRSKASPSHLQELVNIWSCPAPPQSLHYKVGDLSPVYKPQVDDENLG